MYQRDYILRMIEMIGELIAGILGLIRKGKFEEASRSISNIYHDLLKEDASFFTSIPPERLTGELLNEHNYTHGHLEILAELFFAQAELSAAQQEWKESLLFYRKAHILLEYVLKESATFSIEKQAKLESIKKQVELIKKKADPA